MTPQTADRITALIDGVDHTANQMEAKWGRGRLRLLVGADLREKFDRQRSAWNGAVWASDLAAVELHAARMQKAWAVLDKAAADAGEAPLSPLVWETTLPDGRVLAIVRDNADASAVVPTGRYVAVWTLDEIARVLDRHQIVRQALDTFPGATVQRHYASQPDEVPA